MAADKQIISSEPEETLLGGQPPKEKEDVAVDVPGGVSTPVGNPPGGENTLNKPSEGEDIPGKGTGRNESQESSGNGSGLESGSGSRSKRRHARRRVRSKPAAAADSKKRAKKKKDQRESISPSDSGRSRRGKRRDGSRGRSRRRKSRSYSGSEEDSVTRANRERGAAKRRVPSPVRRRSVSESPGGRRPQIPAVAPSPALISGVLGAHGPNEKEDQEEAGTAGKARGRPPRPFQAKALTVPAGPSKRIQWAAGRTQLAVTAQQLQAGMFVQAWIEAQPCLPGLKQATAALFYVCGVGELRSDGMDLEVRAIAARTRELMSELEKGPLSIDSKTGRPAALHLCRDGRCVCVCVCVCARRRV